MLIAIISDIHDNLANLKKCLDWCRQNRVRKIIFCGDTTNLETIQNLAGFAGGIFMVKGNEELYEENNLSQFANIRYLGESGIIKIDGREIGLVHQPRKIETLLKRAKTPPDYIFYGHTHKPWLEKRGATTVVNPGNIAGTWYQATFATLNTRTKKLELKILADLGHLS
ncbi:MAG: metallophosphoesterase family protein [Patescibacteria group bacterium]